MKKDNVHAGHRDRMRRRFLDNGIDGFKTHEVLEMLLYYAVPMKNTSELAHRLLNAFGSVSAVFDASVDALMDFGLTQTQACLIKLIPDVSRLYIDDKHNNSNKVIDYANLAPYMISKFIGRESECVILLLLDAKGKEVFCGVISKGSLNDSSVPIRKIVDFSLRYNAKSAVLAHNHPSGIALPSKDDIETTANVIKALRLIGVNLIDHFIVADNDCVSLAQSGSFFDIAD